MVRCARCQAELAALARTTGTEDGGIETQPSGVGWLIDWRWLAPLAIAVAVWVTDPVTVTEQSAPTASDADSPRIADAGVAELLEEAPAMPTRERPNVQDAACDDTVTESDVLGVLDEASPTAPEELASPSSRRTREDANFHAGALACCRGGTCGPPA